MWGPGEWEQSTAQGRGDGRGVRQGRQRASPTPHSPVSSMAQPVPVRSPGCGPGSPTSPVLEGDLRAQGDREPGGVRHRASPLLPPLVLSQGQKCPSRPSWLQCYPVAVVPAPRAGRDPVLLHARCPQPCCCCSCGPIGPNPLPQDTGHLLQQPPGGAPRCPGTHHLPHAVLALHLGPQLHKALLHALVEGPQVLRHLPPVDPDPLCQQRGLQGKAAQVWLGSWGSLGQGCWRGATGATCQAIRSFSLSMFTWSSGCSFRYDSWKKACSEPRSVPLVAGTGAAGAEWCWRPVLCPLHREHQPRCSTRTSSPSHTWRSRP